MFASKLLEFTLNKISFLYENISRISSTQLKANELLLMPVIKDIVRHINMPIISHTGNLNTLNRDQNKPSNIDVLESSYQTKYAFLNVPSDVSIHKAVMQRIKDIQESTLINTPITLLLIGIGGSNLGTLAVHASIHGPDCVSCPNGNQLLCIDTVDSDQTTSIINSFEKAINNGNQVHINIVSKSGKTTETIAQSALFIDLLKKHFPDTYTQKITITTDHLSPLWHFAQANNIACLTIPAQVGGRYSVLTATGLFPLAFCGIDTEALCTGAQDANKQCTNTDLITNPAAIRSALIYNWYKENIHIHDLFIFDRALAPLGQWYRQLVGESIGKQHDLDGNNIRIGITPTVSIGSTDLHSMGQLYLGGPRERFTTFLEVTNQHTTHLIPNIPGLEKLVPNIAGKSVHQIMNAIILGTQQTYESENLPFTKIVLEQKDEYTIGSLLQTLMIETVYLAHLLQVNPFDQPHVELYKQKTRAALDL